MFSDLLLLPKQWLHFQFVSNSIIILIKFSIKAVNRRETYLPSKQIVNLPQLLVSTELHNTCILQERNRNCL